MVEIFENNVRSGEGRVAAEIDLSEWLADDVLLKMAQQHNQSETAFFVRTDEGYELRWFTTLAERADGRGIAAKVFIAESIDQIKLNFLHTLSLLFLLSFNMT